ncbi:hypothetical protein HCB18_23015, partial [Salinispora arenicola]|uniref:hypothetical protein n=1 Tax=Salinispora arenicola TaxID=168697 RepID=UPI0016B6E92F
MKSRGADRPEDGTDERRKGRRWGRGKAETTADEPLGGEEFGWIDDLRTAKAQRAELGPEDGPGQSTPTAAGLPSTRVRAAAGPRRRCGGTRPEPPRPGPGW